ncbi:MAG TPA: hypothetical protein VL404_08735 [Candidatus Eisenbacteria bacterium]|nr:hypothetical protein [Candidatus Eisenbacteria bacterium]
MSIDQIRDSIAILRRITDGTAALFGAVPDLDESTRSLWISDSKELYYKLVAVWQLLDAVAAGRGTPAPVLERLEAAEGAFEQVSSELRTLGGLQALELDEALRRAFERCWNEVDLELAPFSAQPVPPALRAVPLSGTEIRLPCAICGGAAAAWLIDTPAHEKKPALLYEGIATTAVLPEGEAPRIFAWLSSGDLKSVHEYVRRFRSTEDGMDAYCPDCDKIYCRRHYNVAEEWDEGFYDCARGTCPQGHERIIDD